MQEAVITRERPNSQAGDEKPTEAARLGQTIALRNKLAQLYDEHGPRTYRYLLTLLGSSADAEDALQAAFVELARRPDLLDRVASPAAYLMATARHAALRRRKQSERRRQVETQAGAQILEAREPPRHDADEIARLERALLTLPVEQREVVALKVFEGMTFREIAELLGLPQNTVASRYRYALEKLRELLGDSSVEK